MSNFDGDFDVLRWCNGSVSSSAESADSCGLTDGFELQKCCFSDLGDVRNVLSGDFGDSVLICTSGVFGSSFSSCCTLKNLIFYYIVIT